MIRSMLEPLEGRQLLAASPLVDLSPTGVLTVNRATNVQLTESETVGEVVYTDKSHKRAVTTTYNGVKSIIVTGTRQDDIISVGVSTIDVTINGGYGDDNIIFANGSPYNTTINDALGTNLFSVSSMGGTLDIYTNQESEVFFATGHPENVTVHRS
jgi:hypothetical protein